MSEEGDWLSEPFEGCLVVLLVPFALAALLALIAACFQ